MTSVLLLLTPDPALPALAADLRSAGFTVVAEGECANLVRDALRAQPDVVLCWQPRPDGAFLEAVRTLQAQQSMPLLVFTQDSGVEPMQRALDAGVHGWVVQGYAPHRLRPLVQLAQAREAHERALREQAAELTRRLEERKLLDQAKGVLMRARRVDEQEAFALLRSAAMHGNVRVGQVSRQVIDAARAADAINRAGQQRMLSQRLVKLYALVCHRSDAASALALIRASVARVEENLQALEKELSSATFGDLLQAARAGWQALRGPLEAAPEPQALAAVDALAEDVLRQADALVLALESSGLATTVHIVNVAGRQRMLSQRAAKLALLAAQPGAEAQSSHSLAATVAEFEEGLRALTDAPLSTPEIRERLDRGRQGWEALRQALPQAGTAPGRAKLAAASEALLEDFDQLTAAYQHSIQVLMG
ncbi:ANTAR domain-containing protein [Ramlibacter henchirensis]|uniref:ANTAR domain-containing protein n=1 Tax=Ramlibacter henchirensis TaxID=204072 RepID=A0A4Z0BVE4_9BURK|nr:type IV pili methyl-accepting chemotaxis transducer N-terminal domain-containing protein [Ramlibacter henchirensis]TFZ02228.1 ANTAR domain-containing protein [Ramlibacter henchirensis]